MLIYRFLKCLTAGGGRRTEGQEETWEINKSRSPAPILNVIGA